MSAALDYFNQLTETTEGVTPGKMFGALCMKTANGKSAAMFWKDCIVVKLSGDAYTQTLALDGCTLFDPMGCRPMKEWVQVPFDYKDSWKELLKHSAKAAMEAPVKAKAKKK